MNENPITPVDIRVKEHIRQFFMAEMAKARNIPGMAHAVTIKEMDFERVLDDLWVFINKQMQHDADADRQ